MTTALIYLSDTFLGFLHTFFILTLILLLIREVERNLGTAEASQGARQRESWNPEPTRTARGTQHLLLG